MHLILTGATGVVGSAVLRAMLIAPMVTKVTILSRRRVLQAEGQSKVDVVIHQDFENYNAELMERLKDANGCVWALGIGQNAASKADYIRINKSYTLSFANALANTTGRNTPYIFIFISGEGATHSPGPLTTLYGRIKGETEIALLSLSNSVINGQDTLRVYVVRPGAVDPSDQPDIRDFIPKKGGVLGTIEPPVRAVMSVIYKRMHTPSKEMGQAIVTLATGTGGPLKAKGVEGGGRIVTNIGLRNLAGL
ncbi:hypothetical protein AOQ84DRAFT_310556 [Glonium stellatum]|uniref:NAD(P)-binding domain-containing protein n=1 Tax=Glonium stellatum TaxID=574774 RepID=A0A8E2FBJ7_9PEZI|nr:hypothetical protein AOQ84DRAFT_310556 [Glonium stellatum]